MEENNKKKRLYFDKDYSKLSDELDYFIKQYTKQENKEKRYLTLRKRKIDFFLNAEKENVFGYSYDELFYIAGRLTVYFKKYLRFEEIQKKKRKEIVFHINGKHIKTTDKLFFGYSIKEITGKNKIEKYKKLLDRKYILNLLIDRSLFIGESFALKKNKGEYVSDSCVTYQNKRIKKTNEYLKGKGVKFDNETVSLFELAENKRKNKVAEIYNICRLMNEKANNEKKVWLMTTITAPGVFHINPTKSKNNNWDSRNTAKECDVFITNIYRNTTKQLNKIKKKGEIGDHFGMWCKEPHKSGAIHQHVLFYVDVEDVEKIKETFETASINQFKKIGQKWIKDKSVNFVLEDKEKGGSGSSYVFKYIMKSLNADEYTDNEGNKVEIEQSNRVNSHMKTFKYKRYSFVGIDKGLGIWREIRSIINRTGYKENKNVISESIRSVFDLCLANEYLKFQKEINYQYEQSMVLDHFGRPELDANGEHLYRITGIYLFDDNNDFHYFDRPKYEIIGIIE